jgi:tRNA-splicing ligase RtcB
VTSSDLEVLIDGARAELVREDAYRWRLPRRGAMRVDGVVFATRGLLPEETDDLAFTQIANVATLPGIVRASYAMPDVHWGYGFPIGGVAATDIASGGVVSPGGVGFDISCGVRLMASTVTLAEVRPKLIEMVDTLGRRIPSGTGGAGILRLSPGELDAALADGSRWVVQRGRGTQRDMDRCEDGGAVPDAAVDQISARALERGLDQLGSLGSGNHFLEFQAVDEIYDAATAAAFGLAADQVCVMIHTGSRGLGHQICTDHVEIMQKVMPRYGIDLPDPQLASAPVDSPEGRSYLAAMAGAANYARANRQLVADETRAVFRSYTDGDLKLVYDVSHNLAKLETHRVDGADRQLCVHRKGATRALPPGHRDLPADLSSVGQPVFVPGSMATSSYVLAGNPEGDAFFSACHGAGRVLSRTQASRQVHGRELREEMAAQGIHVRGASYRVLSEEAPAAYKDVDEVVLTCERAGLARRVARLVPIGVVKG